jgi:hypothetical protein
MLRNCQQSFRHYSAIRRRAATASANAVRGLSNAFDLSEPVIFALKNLHESMLQFSISTDQRGGGIVPGPGIRFPVS